MPGDFTFEYTYDDVDLESDVDASVFEVPEELKDQLEQRN